MDMGVYLYPCYLLLLKDLPYGPKSLNPLALCYYEYTVVKIVYFYNATCYYKTSTLVRTYSMNTCTSLSP